MERPFCGVRTNQTVFMAASLYEKALFTSKHETQSLYKDVYFRAVRLLLEELREMLAQPFKSAWSLTVLRKSILPPLGSDAVDLKFSRHRRLLSLRSQPTFKGRSSKRTRCTANVPTTELVKTFANSHPRHEYITSPVENHGSVDCSRCVDGNQILGRFLSLRILRI